MGKPSILLKGQEIKKWSISKFKYVVLFPYKVENGKAKLIDFDIIKRNYPKTAQYLEDAKNILQDRQEGKIKGTKEWYGYIYRKNLEKYEQQKILTQVLSSRNSFTLDERGQYYFVGGGNAGGYGIILNKEFENDYYVVLALLNSKLLEFYLQHISTPFRGGFYSYGKRFIEKLPISIPAEKTELTNLSRKQLERHRTLQSFGDKKTSETAKLELEIKETDKEINDLVYKIYNITNEEIKIIEA